MSVKLGFNTWSMPASSFEQAITLCARLGYDSLEIAVSEGWSTDIDSLPPTVGPAWRRRAAELGVSISSLTVNAPTVVGQHDWRKSRERIMRSIELAASLTADGDSPCLSLGASQPRVFGAPALELSESDWQAEKARIVDRFAEIADLALPSGVRVALEPNVSTFVRRPEQFIYVWREVNRTNFGLNLDISHFAAQGDDSAVIVSQLAKYAFVSEVKDVRGRAPNHEFSIPGEGEFDFASFIGHMYRSGYNGSIAVEISVQRQRHPGYDPQAAAAAAYFVMSTAFEAAGVPRPSSDQFNSKLEK